MVLAQSRRTLLRRLLCFILPLLGCLPVAAQASFLHGETLDKAADVLAIVILIFVPLAGIALFWMVHVLPEKIAEKRHHPQQTAIKTLCLLSLVFGGMLWPLAWLWAYVKPVGYKMAYGTDKHESYFKEFIEKAEKGELTQAELDELWHELESLAARGLMTPSQHGARERLAILHMPPPQQKPAQSESSGKAA
jgi:CBS domain containing-hemolysin-like protein